MKNKNCYIVYTKELEHIVFYNQKDLAIKAKELFERWGYESQIRKKKMNLTPRQIANAYDRLDGTTCLGMNWVGI